MNYAYNTGVIKTKFEINKLLSLELHWKNKTLCKLKRFIKLHKQTGAREGVGEENRKVCGTSLKNKLRLILRFFY